MRKLPERILVILLVPAWLLACAGSREWRPVVGDRYDTVREKMGGEPDRWIETKANMIAVWGGLYGESFVKVEFDKKELLIPVRVKGAPSNFPDGITGFMDNKSAKALYVNVSFSSGFDSQSDRPRFR